MPISAVFANRSSSRAAPSSMEYSVCTCRCTNESLTGAFLLEYAELCSVGSRGRRAVLSSPQLCHAPPSESGQRAARQDAAMRPFRWLGWFALAVIIGHHIGTILGPLGDAGRGTEWADWV